MSPGLTAAGLRVPDDDFPDRVSAERTVPVEPVSTSESTDRRRSVWMAAAQAGDRRAYERVLADSVALIRAVARRHGVAHGELDDVVQETLLTVHRVRHTYDPSRSYDAWLAAIASRRAIDGLRREGRRGRREVRDEDALSRPPGTDDASDPSERMQQAQQLRAAIARLPPGQRQAIEQLGLRERSLGEVSASTGRSPVALKVNLHRALKALRRRFHGEP